jgi:tRNA pseudouridine55 synthase
MEQTTFDYTPYEIEPGVILVDKPKGISSFDCIRILRKKLNIRKMGHAGTLDPNASGLMIIALEKATKRLAHFLKLSKVYEAEIVLGITTDSGDTTGNVLETTQVPSEITEEVVRKAIASLVGELQLPVPIFSAIKKEGKRLYEYAREGVVVEVPMKTMVVHEASIETIELPRITVRFSVASGVYIRSLAVALGQQLKTGATLAGLRRTKIDKWSVDKALKLER